MTQGFLVSATKKSSGKTIVSLGIGAALRKRGLVVQAFKKGPDYIDPNWHARATARECLNLDFRLQSHSEISHTFERYRRGADVVYVEGNKGLFDGMDVHGSDSNAALARYLNLPVVLIIDCEGITRGIAPLLSGYLNFEDDTQFAGVILNRVAGPRHEQKLISSVETYSDIKILGSIRRNANLNVDERHLGLVPSNEENQAELIIQQASVLIEEQVDLLSLLERSKSLTEPQPLVPDQLSVTSVDKKLKLGVARDAAFGFYYSDDLDSFREQGVEIVEFDTINDVNIPEVDALFLGGGFPETHLEALSANTSMRLSISQFIENDGPVYAECGGLMYLCRSINYQESVQSMVGVLQADVVMQGKPVGRGYARLKPSVNHPWLPSLGLDQTIDCHEFHYSRLENINSDLRYAYTVERGYGIDGQQDGLIYKNVLANYSHFRNANENRWVESFIKFIEHAKSIN